MEIIATSNILLPKLREAILTAGKQIDLAIIDVTGDLKEKQLRKHSIPLELYGRQTGCMKLLQAEIDV